MDEATQSLLTAAARTRTGVLSLKYTEEANRARTVLGNRIREARRAAGVNQGTVALAAGVKRIDVSEAERGVGNSRTIGRILAAVEGIPRPEAA